MTLCREEQPYIIKPTKFTSLVSIDGAAMEVTESAQAGADSPSTSTAPNSTLGLLVRPIETDVEQPAVVESESNSTLASSVQEVEPMDLQPSTKSKEIVIPVLKTGGFVYCY